jgi:hypothetical protein
MPGTRCRIECQPIQLMESDAGPLGGQSHSSPVIHGGVAWILLLSLIRALVALTRTSNYANYARSYRGPTPLGATCCTDAAIARRSAATDGYIPASSSTLPISTSAGITPGHSVLAPRNQ